MTTDRRIALDASAILAWVLHERGSETVDRMLPVAMAPVSVVVETLYRAVERGHRMSASELYGDLVAMGLSVVAIEPDDAVRAAELIAASRAAPGEDSLSLGDGLCIAVAERHGLPIAGGDELWEGLTLTVPYYPFR